MACEDGGHEKSPAVAAARLRFNRSAISTRELASRLARLWKEDEKNPLVVPRSGSAATPLITHFSPNKRRTMFDAGVAFARSDPNSESAEKINLTSRTLALGLIGL